MPRSPAISFKLFQNSSSRLTLVLWPAMTIERFETGDFTASPPRISHQYCMTVWLFGQETPRLGAIGDFLLRPCRRQRYRAGLHAAAIEGIGNGAHNRDVRQNCYWRSL